mmetsp:Transcript_6645/g.27883  ORF Transcript_6645/g.27883 Transcript_6645/m.27883 type:complete len:464 (-) Transcript_6645:1231-2622(-)
MPPRRWRCLCIISWWFLCLRGATSVLPFGRGSDDAAAAAATPQAEAPPCPDESPTLRSATQRDPARRSVRFENYVDAELALFWIDAAGAEVAQGTVMPLAETSRDSYDGHAFRVRSAANQSLVLAEHVVGNQRGSTRPHQPDVVAVRACGALSRTNARSTLRDAEFRALIHPPQECDESTPSKDWSCVRYLGPEQLKKRDPRKYGIQPNETTPARAHITVDDTYVAQIPRIPRVTTSPGYQKMSFTQNLKDILVDWYAQRRNDSLKPHGVIPGGYTNNDKVSIDKVNLDDFPGVHAAVVREMRHILEFWTNLTLKHTSTFGVRVYRRDSCLINHVDRMDTHLASAVLQIAQDADDGWPLELYLADRRVAEVYLQPQELVLYEGAWLRHGRPMRFNGREFANVFSHFAPPDWRGPSHDAASMYYGIPENRLTTLADPPWRVLTSDHFVKASTAEEMAAAPHEEL